MFGLFSSRVPQTDPAEVQRRLEEPAPPYLVDVREATEYAQGHIPGSHLIPLGSLAGRLSAVPKDREIVTVCRSGARSGSAAKTLLEAGYRVENMAGGMLAWRGAVER
jgi:rhodanese-related sulfurtransferase